MRSTTACIPLLLATALAAQSVTDAAIVSGALHHGRLPVAALGLGDGGTTGAPFTLKGRPHGYLVTAGGVLVRVQAEGVKLDFPSGAELLVSRDGRVHRRGGERTQAVLHALELWLADGARVCVRRASGGRSPLQHVEVIQGESSVVLWRGRHAALLRGRASAPRGTCFVAVGDGSVLYEVAPLGPVVALRRALSPASRAEELPESRLVIAGDVLSESLRRLPGHVPQHAVQFPQAPEAAANLARGSTVLFPAGAIERPAGAVGELVFPLAAGFRLAVELRRETELWLCLYRSAAALPVVEWRAGPRTTLHLVRPNGGHNGGPRYYLRGIDMSESARRLLTVTRNYRTSQLVLRTAEDLGARTGSKTIPVSLTRR